MDIFAYVKNWIEVFFFKDPSQKTRIYIGLWVVNFFALILSLNFLVDYVLPEQQSFRLRQTMFFIAPVLSLIITFYSITKKDDPKDAFSLGVKYAFAILGSAILLFLLSLLIPQNKNSISLDAGLSSKQRVELQQIGLNEIQIQEIGGMRLSGTQIQHMKEILDEQEIVTKDDLDQWGFTELQLEQLNGMGVVTEKRLQALLIEFGVVTASQVPALIDKYATEVAHQKQMTTATAYYSTCYLILNENYTQLAIRSAPNPTNTKIVGVLLPEQRIESIAHNGEKINVGLWWLVRVSTNNLEETYGWVNSSYVEMINEPACVLLKKQPGL